MPYYNKDPKRDPNFDNHPYAGQIPIEMHIHAHMRVGRQTNRQTDRPTHTHTDRQTDRQAEGCVRVYVCMRVDGWMEWGGVEWIDTCMCILCMRACLCSLFADCSMYNHIRSCAYPIACLLVRTHGVHETTPTHYTEVLRCAFVVIHADAT